jgi:hypothetical protein
MELSTRRISRWAAAAMVGAGLLAATPAWAIITCNSDGDCWRTETKVTFPNVTLTYHEDPWWEEHKTDRTYVFHEADADHDWHTGYWVKKEWHHID